MKTLHLDVTMKAFYSQWVFQGD